jgi:multiple sugar transport system substrate-binding protein
VQAYGLQIKAKTSKAPLNVSGIGDTGTWIVQSLVSSNGGGILSADKKAAIFNQSAAIDTYKWWRGLVSEGVHPPLSVADAQAAFLSGNLAMYLQSTALLNAAESAAQGKFEVRTAAEPAFSGKPVHPVNSGSALFVLTRDPARQHAAWEFLRFAASQRGFTIITSMIGYVPQRDDVIDDPNYLKPVADKDPNILPPFKQVADLEMALNWPGKNGVQAQLLYVNAIQNVIYDGQEPQQVMDDAAARVNDLLKAG